MPLRYPLFALLLVLNGAGGLLPSSAHAQNFDAYGAGGPRSDIGEDVAMDGAGNVYATGSFEGTAQFGALSLTAADDDPNNDWQDVFVVKYDVAGDALWARRAGTGVFNDFAEGIDVDADGNVYVAGYFTGIATWDGGNNPDVSLTTRNDFDGFLAKYDTDGDLQWVAQVGGPAQDTGRGVAVTPDGQHVYFAGGFAGTATFGTDTVLSSAGSSDAFLARYDADGNLAWVRPGGGTEGDGAWDVATDLDGNAFTVGTFRGVALWGALPLQSRGLSDLYVAAYTPSGNPAWVQQIGGNGNDYGRGIAVPLDTWGLYVTGSFENSILVNQDVLTSAGASDVVIARLDPASGALGWGVRGGGTGFDIGNDLALAPQHVGASVYTLYTTGYVDGNGTFSKGTPAASVSYTTNGGVDAFVTVLRDRPGNANPLPSATVLTLGGTNSDRGYGIGTADVGGTWAGVAVTGIFRDQARIGPATLTSAGSNDVYVARLLFRPSSVTDGEPLDGLLAEAEAEPPTRLALTAPTPNPFRDATSVELALPSAQAVRVEVHDALGRRVAMLHDGDLGAGTHTLTWAAEAVPPGVYVVRVVTEEGTQTERVTRLR